MRWSICAHGPPEVHGSSIKERGKGCDRNHKRLGTSRRLAGAWWTGTCHHTRSSLNSFIKGAGWGWAGRTAVGAKKVWMILTGLLHLFLPLQVRLECLSQRRKCFHWLFSVKCNWCIPEVSHLGAIPHKAQVGRGRHTLTSAGLGRRWSLAGGERRRSPSLSLTSFTACP